MRHRIKLLGYYWPTMTEDCMNYAKKCVKCQEHGDIIHRAPSKLHPIVASWPFAEWGTDVVGPFTPTSRGFKFILAATDYFSRWAELVPLREVTGATVARFFTNNIVHRYGMPYRVHSDNGTNFKSQQVHRFAEKYGIKWTFSTIYNPSK